MDKKALREQAKVFNTHLDEMATQIVQHLALVPEFRRFDDATLQHIAEEDLKFVLQSLEAGDLSSYVGFADRRAQERVSQGFSIKELLYALRGIEQVLQEYVISIDMARLLWQLFSQSRDALHVASEDARTAQLAVFRSLAENSADAMLIVDIQGNIMYADHACYDLMRMDYEQQNMLGRPMADFWPKHELPNLEGILALAMQGNWQGEAQQRRADGTIFDAALTLFAVNDQVGLATNIAAIIRNISVQKQAESDLRASEKRFRSLFDSSIDAIFTMSESVFLDCNVTTLDIFGCTREQIIGHSPTEFSPEFQLDGRLSSEASQEYIHKAFAGETQTFEWQHKRLNGNVFDAEVNLVKIDLGDQVYLQAVVRDISRRKTLERQIQETVTRRGYQVQVGTQIAQEISAAPALSEIFERVVVIVKERFGYYHTQILRYEAGVKAVVLVYGYGEIGQKMLAAGHQMPMGVGLIGLAAATGETVLRPDLSGDQDWRPNKLLPETRGEIAVPIKMGARVLGVLDVQSDQVNALTEDDRLLLEGLCGQIAVAIESTRLRQEMEDRLAELNTLYRATSRESWQKFQRAYVGQAYLYDRLDVVPIKSEDVYSESVVGAPVEAGAPLDVRGETVGLLGVYQDPLHPLTDDEMRLIEQVSDQVAQALESARLFTQTQRALEETEILYQASAQIVEAPGLDDALSILVKSTALKDMGQAIFAFFDRPWDASDPQVEIAMPELMINAAVWDRSGHSQEPVGTRYLMRDFPLFRYLDPHRPLLVKDFDDMSDDRLDENARQVSRQVGFRGMAVWPLEAGGEWFGLLFGQSDVPLNLSDTDIRLITNLVEQAATVIRGMRLSQDMQERVRELTSLQRMLSREAWVTYQGRSSGENQGYLYDQVSVQPMSADAILGEVDGAITASASQPVYATTLSVHGEPIGVLGVRQTGGGKISDEDEAFLQTVAEQVAQAMERARLIEQTQKSAVELQAVAEVSTAASSILDPNQLLQSVVDLTKRSFGLYHVHVYLVDESAENLTLAIGAGDVGRSMVEEGWAIPIDDPASLVASVGRDRLGRYASDVRLEEAYLPNPSLPDTLSELAVPMVVADRLLGVFDVQADVVNRFTQEDVRTYTTLASQTAVALQNAKLYAEQLAAIDRLRELDNMKTAFLANMSHELRTPLNSILGFTQVIMEGLDGELTDLMTSDLELIEKNGKHLLNLINDILDMAKIEAGRMNLSMEPLNMYDLLEDVILSNSSLARDKSLYMRVEGDPNADWTVMADHVRIRQVLNNLISNSVKFTEKGGITLELEHLLPTETEPQERIQVRVCDTGLGIPVNKLEEVFEAFSQVDSSTTRKVGGTGLGLPISRRLVEMHGGRLWAFSKGVSGEGSIFYLELPVNHEQ